MNWRLEESGKEQATTFYAEPTFDRYLVFLIVSTSAFYSN